MEDAHLLRLLQLPTLPPPLTTKARWSTATYLTDNGMKRKDETSAAIAGSQGIGAPGANSHTSAVGAQMHEGVRSVALMSDSTGI